jgi:hypothetical protein
MSIFATNLRAADELIRITRWIGEQTEPFEFTDAENAIGTNGNAVRRVCRDMHARGLLERYRGTPRSRPTPNGGAQMWRLA